MCATGARSPRRSGSTRRSRSWPSRPGWRSTCVVPDRPALALRQRPRDRRCSARRARRCGARRRHRGRLLGRQHPALPRRGLDAADLARVPRAQRPRLDAERRGPGPGAPPSLPPPPRRRRCDLRPLPAVAGARLPPRTPMSAPRFPAVAPHRGHYESYYLRAADPARGRSVWIRHTVFKRPGGPPTGALWCTLFEAGEEPRAVKQSLPDPRAGEWLAIGDSHFGPHGAHGRAEALGRSAEWDLRFGPSSEPLRHLPHPRLYDAPLPRTKTESPLPDTAISGTVADWELDGWRGMVGHNWGSEHAERWIWLHAVGFDG